MSRERLGLGAGWSTMMITGHRSTTSRLRYIMANLIADSGRSRQIAENAIETSCHSSDLVASENRPPALQSWTTHDSARAQARNGCHTALPTQSLTSTPTAEKNEGSPFAPSNNHQCWSRRKCAGLVNARVPRKQDFFEDHDMPTKDGPACEARRPESAYQGPVVNN